jgi:signal peptidase I
MTEKSSKKVEKDNIIKYVRVLEKLWFQTEETIFPIGSLFYRWNNDCFGPITIPKKGATVHLNIENLDLYRRIIETYEKNEVRTEYNKIFINNIQCDSYTFKLNYYFVLDDNRDHAKDSRNWGFLPESHIIGTASFIWFSTESLSRIGTI